jgi:hypothetical protein
MNWFWSITETHTHYDGLDRVETIPQETNTNSNSWFRLDFFLLNCVFQYSKTQLALVQFGKMIQEKWPALRCIAMHTHTLAFFIGTTFHKIFCHKPRYYTEPTSKIWINITSLLKNPPPTDNEETDVFDVSSIFSMEEQYNESYTDSVSEGIFNGKPPVDGNPPSFTTVDGNPPVDGPPPSFTEWSKIEFQNACNSASRIFSRQSNVEEIVVWLNNAKRKEQIVRVWTSQSSTFPLFTPEPPNYSNVKFVYIEYQHPKMNGVTIEIVLSKSLLVVGNELFSAGFICRWLHYFAETEFVFDDNYILSIMDDNINQYTLRYGEYLVLEKDGLVQMTPPPDSCESSVVEDGDEPEDSENQ